MPYPARRHVNPAGPNAYAPIATTAADFNVTGANHAVKRNTGDNYYYRDNGDISVFFGGPNVTVTNLSGETWGAGETIHVNLVPVSYTTETGFASPAGIPTARPGTTSLANDAAGGGLVSKDDFATAPRPGSGLSGAPAGTPSRGALEAV